MNYQRIIYCIAGLVILFSAGCSREYSGKWAADIVLSEREIPIGFRMIPSDEMPLTRGSSWWKRNPQLFEGWGSGKAKAHFASPNGNTKAKKILAAAYDSDEVYRVIFFALQYKTRDAAEHEFDNLHADDTQDNKSGISKNFDRTMIIMSMTPGCPNEEFFQEYFRSITNQP